MIRLEFEFQKIHTNLNNLEVSSIELSNLLEKKVVKDFLESKNLSIFMTSQLIEAEDNRLLIQQQLCILRGYKARRYKLNWFKEIKKKLLADSITREIVKDLNKQRQKKEKIDCYKRKEYIDHRQSN